MSEKYNILIVDEGEPTLQTFKESLTLQGYKVDLYSKGQTALKKFKEKKYHIVLLHIELPDGDGIELLREMKEYDSLAQIIIMSSNSKMEKIISALEHGANDYIHKPVTPEILRELVDHSIAKLERWKKAMLHLIQ